MIQLAVSTYSLSKWQKQRNKTLIQSLNWMAENDIAAVEFSGIDETRSERLTRRAGQLRKHCEKLGLAICGYCIGAELLQSPKKQREQVELLKRHVDVAATLGVRSMRHDVTRGNFDAMKGYKGPKTLNAVLKIVVPAIREVADYAAERGVITTLENHGFYMQAPNRVEKLLQKVDHENYALTLDMGNFLCANADPVEAVKQMLPYAVHVHVKDFHIKPKTQAPETGWIKTPTPIAIRGSIVGHGNIDIPAQLQLLKRAKYQGYLSLEFEGLEDPPFAVLEGLNYLRNELAQRKMLT